MSIFETVANVLPISQIDGLDGYLSNYGRSLGRKCVEALRPLHIEGRESTSQHFADITAHNPGRTPFPAQSAVISAAVQMFNSTGSGFLCGEMGTGKTIMGQLAVYKHAMQSRGDGGYGGRARALVLCPEGIIAKWKREILETIPNAKVFTFGHVDLAEEKPKKPRAKKGHPKVSAPAQISGTRACLRDTVALIGGKDVYKIIKGEQSPRANRTSWVSTGVDTAEEMPVTPRATAGQVVSRLKRWDKPDVMEFYVIGRNQAKWMPFWDGICDVRPPARLPDAPEPVTAKRPTLNRKPVVLKRDVVVDSLGYRVYKDGVQQWTKEFGYHYTCPSCGHTLMNGKDVPQSARGLSRKTPEGKTIDGSEMQTCTGRYMQMVAEADRPKLQGLDRQPLPARYKTKKADGTVFAHGGYKWIVKDCKEPLANWTSDPVRYAPAKIIQKKLKGMFNYLVVDEVHEHKSDESAQSMGCGKLISCTPHVLALTGTIIGGFASHLYPLMMRITPKSLRAEGFVWGKDGEFVAKYGRIDKIFKSTDEEYTTSHRGNMKSMRKSKGKAKMSIKHVPGVMPSMFSRHMIGSSIFITLEEMADELPNLFEYIGGPCQPLAEDADEVDAENHKALESGWVDCAFDMLPGQKAEYDRCVDIMAKKNKDLLVRGSTKFLSAMLWFGLDYPDKPFGWGHDSDVKKAFRDALAENPNAELLAHTVGYWDKPKVRTFDNFVGVLTPQDCPEETIYPKEQGLIDICLKQKAEGIQTWVYVQMTGKRDVQPRLKGLLEKAGLKVCILRSTDVKPEDREAWITKNGRDFDVVLSHPQLVGTGLDLFSKDAGGHNYSTIVFYETGYNAFTMRQAARRAWRISQPRDCRLYYMYYRGTMQHKAMVLMSKKISASLALEGEFSSDGLAAMAGDDNLQMALAKTLSERIDDSDMQRSWGKVKSMPKKKAVVVAPTTLPFVAPKKGPGTGLACIVKDVVASPMDSLPIELQIVAETIIDLQNEQAAAAEVVAPVVVPTPPTVVVPTPAPLVAEEVIYQMPVVEDDDNDDDFGPMPVLTEAIMMKMFANMAGA